MLLAQSKPTDHILCGDGYTDGNGCGYEDSVRIGWDGDEEGDGDGWG